MFSLIVISCLLLAACAAFSHMTGEPGTAPVTDGNGSAITPPVSGPDAACQGLTLEALQPCCARAHANELLIMCMGHWEWDDVAGRDDAPVGCSFVCTNADDPLADPGARDAAGADPGAGAPASDRGSVSLSYDSGAGMLVYMVRAQKQRPCDSLSVDVAVMESYPPQVQIDVRREIAKTLCVEVVTEDTVRGSVLVDTKPGIVTVRLDDKVLYAGGVS